MGLPEPLRRLRSTLAGALAIPIRWSWPATLRLSRFWYECSARAQLRGRVAPGVQFIGPIRVEGEGLINIGPGTRIGRGVVLETYDGAVIDIGAAVTINDGVTICAYHGIRIGDATMVGEYASIRDANHGLGMDTLIREQAHEGEPIRIGQDCWVARGAIILRGVTMEDGSVAAANSVVNKPVPSNVVVGGVPAKPIGNRR